MTHFSTLVVPPPSSIVDSFFFKMPKVCGECLQEYDGRRSGCPFCKDDLEYEEDKLRRQSLRGEEDKRSESRNGGGAGLSAANNGAYSAARGSAHSLNQSIDELADVSSIMVEFNRLSMDLNSRMHRMEVMVADLAKLIPKSGGSDNQNAGSAVHRQPFNFRSSSPVRTHEGVYSTAPTRSSATGGAAGGPAAAVAANNIEQDAQMAAAILDGAEPEGAELATGGRLQDSLSKFDLRRFLPAAERRKPLNVENAEKLLYLLTRLMEDLSGRGLNVTGLLQHISYVSWMAATGIYATEALVEYDYEMRDRAKEHGCGAFNGGDTHLSNMFLGTSGTKAHRSQAAAARGGNRGRGGFSNSAGRGQGLTGWKKKASEQNICFEHAQGRRCDGCRFRHVCTCGSADHNMLNCPHYRRGGGDRGGGSGGTA